MITTLAATLAVPSAAFAADALSPIDGDVVSSRPTFVFDVLKGAADIELSRSPETLTAGPSAGEFVDEAASEFAILYMRNPRDGVAPWESPIPLNSGQYYWHVRLRDDSVDSDGDGFMEGTQYPWGPVRTLTVSDEPPVFEGWIIRVQLLRPVGRCKTRLRVYGTISWSDNEEEPSATYSVSLKAGARVLGRVRGTFDTTFRPRFDGAICSTRRVTARSLTATAALRDTSEQLVIGDPRKVRNPAR